VHIEELSLKKRFDFFLGFLIFGSISTSITFRTDIFILLLVILAIFIWFKSWHQLRSKQTPLVIRFWIFTLIVYALVWFFSLYNTVGATAGDYEKPAKVLVCAFIASQLVKRRIRSEFIKYGMVFCILLAAISAGYSTETYSSGSRLDFGMNAGLVAYQLMVAVLFCMTHLIFGIDLKLPEKTLFLIFILVGIWTLSETQTRGVVLVFIAYAAVLVPLKIRDLILKRDCAKFSPKIAVVAIVMAVLAVLMFTNTKIQERFLATFDRIDNRIDETIEEITRIQSGDLEGAIGRRVALYQVGMEAVKTPSLLGKGENAAANLSSYISLMKDPERYEFIKENIHFHNQYLDIFTKRGGVGILIFIAFLFGPLVYANPKQRIYLLSAILPLAVGGLVETPLNSSNFVKHYPLYVTFILVFIFQEKPTPNQALNAAS